MDKGSNIFEEVKYPFLYSIFTPHDVCSDLGNVIKSSIIASDKNHSIESMSEVLIFILNSVINKSPGSIYNCLDEFMNEMESLICEYKKILNVYMYPIDEETGSSHILSHQYTSGILGWKNHSHWSVRSAGDIPQDYKEIFSKDKDPKKSPVSQIDSNNLSDQKQLSVLSDKPKKLEKKRIFSTKYSCYIRKKGDWNSYHALKRHLLQSHVGRNGLLDTKCNNINNETSHDIAPGSSHAVHKNKNIKGTDKSFNCTLCDKKYTTNYQLKIHTRNIHDGIVVNCRKCGKQVKSLVYHKKVCQMTYPCDKCGKVFNYNSSLKDHIESIHEGIKHICSFCASKHATKRGLNKHMRTTCQGIDNVKDLSEKNKLS